MNSISRFLRNRQVSAGLILTLVLVAVALFAPLLSPPDPPRTLDEAQFFRGSEWRLVRENVEAGIRFPQPPDADLWFGTDARQYDLFHTFVWGMRTVLRFGIIVTLCTALLGILIGAFSGYAGGWVQAVTLRLTDAFLAVPIITAVWVMGIAVFGWGSSNSELLARTLSTLRITPTMLAFILFMWMPYARVVNAAVLQLKSITFIQAAEALGASPVHVVFRHLIPNALSPIIVLMARDVGGVVAFASALEAIGVGSASEWGAVLAQNRVWVLGLSGNVLEYWWVYVPITLGFVLFGMAWNLLGDGLNMVLNPKSS